MPRDLPQWILDRRRAVGVRIQELREHRNLRQPQLAERAGIDLRQLQRIEAGTADLRFHELLLIAATLGTTPTSLIAEPDDRTSEPL